MIDFPLTGACRAGPITTMPPPTTTPRRGHRRRRDRSTDAGYSTLETVLLLPLLVVFTVMLVQYALVLHARTVAQSAARHGVDAARAYTATDADGHRQAHDYLTTLAPALLRDARIEVTRTGTTVAVRIHARVLTVPGIPFAPGVDERSSGPVERFVSPSASP